MGQRSHCVGHGKLQPSLYPVWAVQCNHVRACSLHQPPLNMPAVFTVCV